MIEWLKTHWQTLGSVTLITGAYALSKFPGLLAEHDYIVAVGWVLGVYGTAFVPGFARTKDKSE